MDSRFGQNQDLLDFVSKSGRASMRLRNAIQRAEARDELPYRTIKAYLDAGEAGRWRMLRLENLGRKSLAELDQLIAEEAARPAAVISSGTSQPGGLVRKDLGQEGVDNSDEDLLRLPLDAFLAGQLLVSARLANAISTAVGAGVCPFETIGDYLRCHRRQEELQRIENLGRKSSSEFERLVARSVSSSPPSSIQVVQNEFGYFDLGRLVKDILSLLTERQQAILLERLLERRTLEAVAATRGVTRERIRQIEAKSLRIVLTKGGAALRQSAKLNCVRLCERRLFELSVEVFANLATCDVKDVTLYVAFLKKVDSGHSPLGLFEGQHLFVRSQYAPRADWKTTLAEELRLQPLPLTLDGVLSSVATVPGFYVRDYFQRRWGTQSEDANIGASSYGTTRMCIDVLRKAGGPLHTSDVRVRICALFQIDIEEHAINASLGRLRAALITAPGTYALYESLPYTAAQLRSIRDTAHQHLASKGVFVSSKLLFDQAFAPKVDEYPGKLNHYLVMGIVQDDERFTTKRGNMVGLASFDLTATYMPLQDEVRKIVIEHGPVSLQEISERLSDTRRLCNDSGIRQVLSQSPEIIRIGRRTFDSLHRFFETREVYEDLLLAVRLSLLERRKTTYAIAQDLSRLPFQKLTSHLVESLLFSMDDVRSEGDFHELVEQSDELRSYDSAVVRSLCDAGSVAVVRASLVGVLPSERVGKLTSLDTRFFIPMPSSQSSATDTELGSILRDFDF